MTTPNTKYKKEEKKVPNLRFPEFEGEWTKKDFGKMVEKSKSKYDPRKNNKDYPCIELESISKESSLLLEVFSSSNQKSIKNRFKNGDILFGKLRPNLKKYLIASFDGVCSSEIWVLVGKEISNEFLFRVIQTNKFYNASTVTTGSKMPRADWDFISSFPFFIPSLPEQQKIASFLSAVDQKIQQLTCKKGLLEQYKKGVMQKIFSREIRFRDENGNDFPDWEEKRLGDILTFVSTNSLSRNDLNYDSGEIKNIHYGDIHTTFKMGFDVEKEKVPFINEEVDLRKITKDQFCQVGDIVVADASEDYSDIGKAIEVLNVGNERIVAGLHTFLARDTIGQTIKGFKGYLFQTWQIRKQIMKVAQGISVLGISKKNLAKVEFLLPCREEQGKITTLLRNIDKKIANTLTQLTQTKKFKKGLLQQMFV